MNDKLVNQLKALEENPQMTVAYSWSNHIDENDQYIVSGGRFNLKGDVYEKLLVANFLENGSNPLIRRENLISLGGFDESLPAGQDWDMWLRLAARFEFICVPHVHILYRTSENSISTNLPRQEKACLFVLDKACQERQPTNNFNIKESLANLYQYLTRKSLQKPYSRHKALTGIKFLYYYTIYEYLNLQKAITIARLALKILIVIISPPLLYLIEKKSKYSLIFNP